MDANGNSEAQDGYGSGFFLRVGGVWVEMDEVTDIPIADPTADDYEVTHFKSPGKTKEYRSGWNEPGEGSLVVNYIAGSPTDVALKEARASGEVCPYESYVPAPDDKWMKTEGFLIVKSRGRAIPMADRMQQTVNVRFTGAPTEAIATEQRDVTP